MKKLGFTLAEVLITLVIIGVIAAMTVPTLMNNTQGQENKTAFKKAISAMNQALTLEYALEGNTAATKEGTDDDITFDGLYSAMIKRTNVISEDSESWKGSAHGRAHTIVTADGIVYAIPATNGVACAGEDPSKSIYEQTPCTTLTGLVDVNGAKGPNTQVKNSSKPEDIFEFMIFETKVVPGKSADSVEAAVMYDKKNVAAKSGT